MAVSSSNVLLSFLFCTFSCCWGQAGSFPMNVTERSIEQWREKEMRRRRRRGKRGLRCKGMWRIQKRSGKAKKGGNYKKCRGKGLWHLLSCLFGMGGVTWATPILLPKKGRQGKWGEGWEEEDDEKQREESWGQCTGMIKKEGWSSTVLVKCKRILLCVVSEMSCKKKPLTPNRDGSVQRECRKRTHQSYVTVLNIYIWIMGCVTGRFKQTRKWKIFILIL